MADGEQLNPDGEEEYHYHAQDKWEYKAVFSEDN
jgi:hypothetical protein